MAEDAGKGARLAPGLRQLSQPAQEVHGRHRIHGAVGKEVAAHLRARLVVKAGVEKKRFDPPARGGPLLNRQILVPRSIHQRRENGLEAEAPSEIRVIDVLPQRGQEIP